MAWPGRNPCTCTQFWKKHALNHLTRARTTSPQPTNYLKPTYVLSQSPYLEFRVVHPLEYGLRAGLAAGSGSGAAKGGEEAARRGAEEGGAPAPPEERQDLRLRRRRHGVLVGTVSGVYGLSLAGDFANFLATNKPAECRWIDKGWATFRSGPRKGGPNAHIRGRRTKPISSSISLTSHMKYKLWTLKSFILHQTIFKNNFNLSTWCPH